MLKARLLIINETLNAGKMTRIDRYHLLDDIFTLEDMILQLVDVMDKQATSLLSTSKRWTRFIGQVFKDKFDHLDLSNLSLDLGLKGLREWLKNANNMRQALKQK